MTDIDERLEINFDVPRDVATVAFALYEAYEGARCQRPGISPRHSEEHYLLVTEGKLGAPVRGEGAQQGADILELYPGQGQTGLGDPSTSYFVIARDGMSNPDQLPQMIEQVQQTLNG